MVFKVGLRLQLLKNLTDSEKIRKQETAFTMSQKGPFLMIVI